MFSALRVSNISYFAKFDLRTHTVTLAHNDLARKTFAQGGIADYADDLCKINSFKTR